MPPSTVDHSGELAVGSADPLVVTDPHNTNSDSAVAWENLSVVSTNSGCVANNRTHPVSPNKFTSI